MTTANHENVTAFRAMDARGYLFDSPNGIAYREGWHDKDLDAQKYGAVSAAMKEKEIADLHKRIAQERNDALDAFAAYAKEHYDGLTAACITVDIENMKAQPKPTYEPEIDTAMENLVEILRGFTRAYPEDIFTPLTKEETDQHANIVTRASAGMGRHVAKYFSMAADAIERLAVKDAERFPSITLEARQLIEALEFIAPDREKDPDELDMEVTIVDLPADKAPLDDDNKRMPAGLYAYITDYPEEGYIPLFDIPADAAQPNNGGGQ